MGLQLMAPVIVLKSVFFYLESYQLQHLLVISCLHSAKLEVYCTKRPPAVMISGRLNTSLHSHVRRLNWYHCAGYGAVIVEQVRKMGL